MRLYAATGDGIARLDQAGGAWEVQLSLSGSGAQCLALDLADPDTVYAGLRDGGVQRTTDGGRTWVDCALPGPGVFSLAVSAADGAVYAGTEPSATAATTAERPGGSSKASSSFPHGRRGAFRRGRGHRMSGGSHRARTTPI